MKLTVAVLCSVFFASSAAFAAEDAASATMARKLASVSVGAAVRLPLVISDAEKTQFFCQSSNPKVAQAFNNGFCFGISPGSATVDLKSRIDQKVLQSCTVTVAEEKPQMVSASSIRQLPDNKKFKGRDGRECYGCELNCRQPESSGTVGNRVVNPHPVSDPTDWEVEKDAKVYDGAGKLIGTVSPRQVGDKSYYLSKFNHGMTKILNEEIHVYSFATPIRLTAGVAKAEDSSVSAWLPLREVIAKEELLDVYHPGSGQQVAVSVAKEGIPITGGNPKAYDTPAGFPMRIVKNVNTPPKPHDYLKRPAGTINLLFAVPGFGLGGHSLDSFLISSQPVFHPAEGIHKITVPTYYPPEDLKAGEVTPKTMTFVYGAVEANGSPQVYGWLAEEALK